MVSLARARLSLCLAAVAVAGCTSPAAAQVSPRFAAADALLADSLAQIGGRAVFAVVGPEGVRHVRAFGPIAEAAAVPIASATKWLSGAVILSLVDSGELSLDTRVSALFPEAPAPVRTATVRQLFSHTSGIRAQPPCLQDRATTLDACALSILAFSPLAQPGAAFVYGGGSMQVAAAMAERATGQSWAALFEARVAGPLGLTRTTYGATGNPWIGGGADASARNYGTFLQMVLLGGVAPPGTPAAGRRVLSEASVAAMFADQTGGAPVVYSPFSPFVGPGPALAAEPRYGVGLWRETVDARGALRVASSPGAYGFWPWIDVPSRTAGVLLVVSSVGDVAWTAFELERRVEAATATVVSAGPAPASEARLGAPRPNPAARRALVRVDLAAAGRVRVDVFDVRGRRVAGDTRGVLAAGTHEITVDVSGLAGGVYVAVLRVDGRVAGRQRLVVR